MSSNKSESSYLNNIHHCQMLFVRLLKVKIGWSSRHLKNGLKVIIFYQDLWLIRIWLNIFLVILINIKRGIFFKMILLDYLDLLIGNQSIPKNSLNSLLWNSNLQKKHSSIFRSTLTNQLISKDSKKLDRNYLELDSMPLTWKTFGRTFLEESKP